MAGHLPWFKVYAAETLSDERFSGWTIEERGAWFTLLVHAWREGSIPSDTLSIARLLHVDASAMRSLWSAIGDRFVEHPDHPGRLTSPRLEMEREAGHRMLERKSAAGRAGATSRWDRKNHQNGRRITAACVTDATPMRFDSASGEERAGKPQERRGEAKAPLLPSKDEALRREYPATATLLDADPRFDFAGKHETRQQVERAILAAGQERALAAAVASYATNPKPYLGWHLDALRAAALPAVDTTPLPVLDLAWIGELPEPRRTVAETEWGEAQAAIQRTAYPGEAPRLLAAQVDVLRRKFTTTGATP